MGFSALVPELVVTDINASLQFWCGVVGFTVWYDRPEEHFAYLSLGEAQIMLEQHCPGDRGFVNGALAQPFGRGSGRCHRWTRSPTAAPGRALRSSGRWRSAGTRRGIMRWGSGK